MYISINRKYIEVEDSPYESEKRFKAFIARQIAAAKMAKEEREELARVCPKCGMIMPKNAKGHCPYCD